MGKMQTTAKFIRELPEPKVRVGYGDLQHLFNYRSPFAYTCGIYGWNFDAYDLGEFIVTTGYRNTMGTDVYDIARKYDELAREYLDAHRYVPGERKRDALDELVERFKAEVLDRIS